MQKHTFYLNRSLSDPSSPFSGRDGILNLTSLIFDLFLGGSETTSPLLNWTILYLTRNPEIQARMSQELERVIGKSRMPTVADRNNTPYTEAVLQVHGCITFLAHSLFLYNNIRIFSLLFLLTTNSSQLHALFTI